jgi:hypothetical protein
MYEGIVVLDDITAKKLPGYNGKQVNNGSRHLFLNVMLKTPEYLQDYSCAMREAEITVEHVELAWHEWRNAASNNVGFWLPLHLTLKDALEMMFSKVLRADAGGTFVKCLVERYVESIRA